MSNVIEPTLGEWVATLTAFLVWEYTDDELLELGRKTYPALMLMWKNAKKAEDEAWERIRDE